MDELPEYGRSGSPPSYEFPQTFAIGQKRTRSPLVTSVQLKNHLALLRTFVDLRTKVDELKVTPDGFQGLPANQDRRWAWFVGLAVDRFASWCDSLADVELKDGDENRLPPLDVLMVWHAYLLNPSWYAEDTLRVPSLRPLAKFTPILAKLLSSDPERFLLVSEPTSTRIESWKSRTGKPFDPFEDAQHSRERQIFCPKCRGSIQAPYINSSGSGYLQGSFRILCPSPRCKYSPSITKASLAARKLAEDLVRTSTTDPLSPCLAGTLRTAQVSADPVRGKIIKDTILRDSTFRPSNDNEQWIRSILTKTSYYDLKNLHTAVTKSAQAKGGQLGKRIISAYNDGDRFSVDLAGAVVRQGSFTKKMHGLNWTDPEFFASSEDEVALQHAIARYHAFLDLMSASPASFYVPTLDVDLAWHTHQLMGDIYNEDCMSYVGRYVDHNDKVEEGKLASAFDLTCRAWKDRFGIAYTHCGCPLPGQTIGQRLSRLVAHHMQQPSYLVPPPRDDLLAATHPSDHDAALMSPNTHTTLKARERRRAQFEKRKKREEQQRAGVHAKGKADHHMTPEERRRADERSYGHDPAFLVPVPLYYGYGVGACSAAGMVVQPGGDMDAGHSAGGGTHHAGGVGESGGTSGCGGTAGGGGGDGGGGDGCGGGGCGGCGGCGG